MLHEASCRLCCQTHIRMLSLADRGGVPLPQDMVCLFSLPRHCNACTETVDISC